MAASCWSACRCCRCITTSAAAISRTRFGERFHWYSSTGWIMWNSQAAGLLNGTTCCIFDGSPGGSKDKPDWTTLWRFVGRVQSDLLRRRRGVLRQLHEGRASILRLRRSLAPARARLDRLAAQRRHASLVQRALRRAGRDQRHPAHSATCGGRTSPAAPISPAPSSAAIASCRRRRARCNAGCSAARSRPSTSTAAP